MKNLLLVIIMMTMLTACQQPHEVAQDIPTDILATSWQLLPEQSTLSFVTTKNKVVTEEHTIQFQGGQLTSNRDFEAIIDLNTVDTLIPIRDQRLKDILFQTESFPHAVVNASLPNELTLNQTTNLAFSLELHGLNRTFDVPVLVQMVADQLVVINYQPVVVNAKDFDLDDAVNQLTKIAGLQSINYEVQVDFKLVFEK